MFFVAAKVFWALMQPSNLMAVLAASGLVVVLKWRRLGIGLFIAATLLLIVFGVLPTGKLLIAPLEDRFPRPSVAVVDAAAGLIVLGGSEDPRMSRARGIPALGSEAARLAEAATLAHRLGGKPVLYTGGYREPGGITQADVARDFLLAIGVDITRLMLENRSQDTAENAIYTQKILGQKAARRWLLVTSAFHMPRAMGAFRRAGVTVTPYPVAYRTTGNDGSDWGFDVAGNLRLSDLAVHEWIGLLAYYLAGRTDALYPAP